MATDANTGQGIFVGATRSGLRNVGSYQVSGHPYITGSTLNQGAELKVSFPYVTKKVSVIASGSQTGTGLRVHFAATSSGAVIGGLHYISLNTHEDSIDLDVKCKEIYLSCPGSAGGTTGGAFMLYASLTNIPTGSMYTITGSGITDDPSLDHWP